MSKVYRWCLITHCKNTSINMPGKTFVQVPSDKVLRNLWLQAGGRDPERLSSTSSLFVCEDHFDLPSDMENYMKWKMTGGSKKMKRNVIPHLNLPLTAETVSVMETRPSKKAKFEVCEDSTSTTFEHLHDLKFKDIGITAKPHYRSKYVQTSHEVTHQSCSPIKIPEILPPAFTFKKSLFPRMYSSETVSSSTSATKISGQEFVPSSSNEEELEDPQNIADLQQKLTIRNINLNPKRYLGISKESIWILSDIEDHTALKRIDIYVTLKKIRTAHTFAELADDFGVSESTVTRMFNKAVPLISPLMKELILWPNPEKIKRQLPKAFRGRYGKVESIIDCLEIEIMKPSDSVKQALTWSEYKKANTLKYLISSTPDGIINFISKGYGGRTTDQTIVETCGYLDIIKPGTVVMADRGFKNIDKLLCEKKCVLVRPPSVNSDSKMLKEEVLQTKRIASLRIHIERVIRRLREYKFLKPHACIHSKLIPLTDHVVTICCGLINIQDSLIK